MLPDDEGNLLAMQQIWRQRPHADFNGNGASPLLIGLF